ncbi:MAG TPA: hypothetical protein VHL98_03375 [Microvirga sp.]|jgi:ribonuclease E|nr:hypothetical protein [Microvirga sp.]
MLALVQIAAAVVLVLLVIAMVRLTRSRQGREEPAPEGLERTRRADADASPMPPAPLLREAAYAAVPAAGTGATAPLLPEATRMAVPAAGIGPTGPAAPARTAPIVVAEQTMGDSGSRTVAAAATAATARRSAPAGADADDGLWELVLRLQDRAMALEAERSARAAEIAALRAALADARREVEALRGARTAVEVHDTAAPARTDVEVHEPVAPEPRLPNVNIYELRPARRR